MYESVELHCIHALPKHFNPNILKGRDIISTIDAIDENLIVEGGGNPDVTRCRIISLGGGMIMTEGYDGVKNRQYNDVVMLKAFNDQGETVAFAFKGESGKLVTTTQGKVVGVIFAHGEEVGAPVTAIVSAKAFFNPPPEPVRVLLKDSFNKEVLSGRAVVQEVWQSDSKYAVLEGRPDKIWALARGGLYQEIDGREYTHTYKVYSHYETRDASYAGLREAQDKELLCGEGDIGKLVLVHQDISKEFNVKTAPVFGIVVAAKNHYNKSHKRWHQTAYICPAHDLLIP